MWPWLSFTEKLLGCERRYRLKPRFSSSEKNKNEDRSEIVEMLVATQRKILIWKGVKRWKKASKEESKNENLKRSRTSQFQGPRRVWHFPRILIVCAAETQQVPGLEMLSILMLSLVICNYLLCIFSKWIIAVYLQTVYSTTVKPLHKVKIGQTKRAK